MLCPDCKKEVGLSRGNPQVSRVRVVGTTVHATVELKDLCDECLRSLQEAKLDIERDLKDVPSLKPHQQHKWHIEHRSAARILDPEGYATTQIHYGLTCECEQLSTYEGMLLGSAKMVVQP